MTYERNQAEEKLWNYDYDDVIVNLLTDNAINIT